MIVKFEINLRPPN